MKKSVVDETVYSKKEVINFLQNVNLTFQVNDVEYLNIVRWLKDNIWLEKVKPLIAEVSETDNIDSAINRVMNILKGAGVNGTIPLEKTVFNDVPSKTRVEVTLL